MGQTWTGDSVEERIGQAMMKAWATGGGWCTHIPISFAVPKTLVSYLI